jgi:hypothetical protein
MKFNRNRHVQYDQFSLPSGGFNVLANTINDILTHFSIPHNIHNTTFIPEISHINAFTYGLHLTTRLDHDTPVDLS